MLYHTTYLPIGEASINRRYVKGHILSKGYRTFKDLLEKEIAWNQAPIEGPVAVAIDHGGARENQRDFCRYLCVGDVDSPAKAILDTLTQSKVFIDDTQVSTLFIRKHIGTETEIFVWPLSPLTQRPSWSPMSILSLLSPSSLPPGTDFSTCVTRGPVTTSLRSSKGRRSGRTPRSTSPSSRKSTTSTTKSSTSSKGARRSTS